MTLAEMFPKIVVDLIDEYNINAKFNSYLYKNSGIEKYMRSKGVLTESRFNSVDRCNEISRKLSPIISELYHGKKVKVMSRLHGEQIGTINHPPDKDVSFRYNHNEPVNITTSNEHIELWVDTGNSATSHLYSTLEMQLVG